MLTVAMNENRRALHDLQDIFAVADRSESGALTSKEFAEMSKLSIFSLKQPDRPVPVDAEQYAKDLVKSMDLDGDEKITYAEFMAFCLGRRKEASMTPAVICWCFAVSDTE